MKFKFYHTSLSKKPTKKTKSICSNSVKHRAINMNIHGAYELHTFSVSFGGGLDCVTYLSPCLKQPY